MSKTMLIVVMVVTITFANGCQNQNMANAGNDAINELAQQGVSIEDVSSVSIHTQDGETISLSPSTLTSGAINQTPATTEIVIDHTTQISPSQEVILRSTDSNNVATEQEEKQKDNPLVGELVSIDEKFITVKATFHPDYPKPNVVFECRPKYTGFKKFMNKINKDKWIAMDPIQVGNDDMAALKYEDLLKSNCAYRVRVRAIAPVWGLKDKVIWESEDFLKFNSKLKENELIITNCQSVPANTKGCKRKYKIWFEGRKGRAAYHLGFKTGKKFFSKWTVWAKNIGTVEQGNITKGVFYCEVFDAKNDDPYSMVPQLYIMDGAKYKKVKHIKLKKEWLVKPSRVCSMAPGHPVD